MVPKTIYANLGDTVYFDCHMRDYKSWTFENVILPVNAITSEVEHNTVFRITINKVDMSNAGVYICRGTNSINKSVRAFGILYVSGEFDFY